MVPADGAPKERPRSALICHAGDELNEDGVARWLASFTDLRLIVRIHEPRARKIRRVRREIERVGALRFLDVLAFRVAHRVVHGSAVAKWYAAQMKELHQRYPAPTGTTILDVANANDPPVPVAFREHGIELALARCKQILARRVFEIPRYGVFVLHPGICPEYRNAHGGFWALAQGDNDRVGTTLLKIDAGVDTGPVYGYFTAPYDRGESHLVIQDRTLLANLDAVRDAMLEVVGGTRARIDTSGRSSGEWGQPWLTKWLAYRRRAS